MLRIRGLAHSLEEIVKEVELSGLAMFGQVADDAGGKRQANRGERVCTAGHR